MGEQEDVTSCQPLKEWHDNRQGATFCNGRAQVLNGQVLISLGSFVLCSTAFHVQQLTTIKQATSTAVDTMTD